jgi:hypothetical protein
MAESVDSGFDQQTWAASFAVLHNGPHDVVG